MTARDHLLGHPNAVRHEVDEAAEQLFRYPLGIPIRVTQEYADMPVVGSLVPTIARLLPTGNTNCTASDYAGIGQREDISKARIRHAVAELGAQIDTLRAVRNQIGRAITGANWGD